MPDYMQYRFLDTVPCLSAKELAEKLLIPPDQFYRVVELLVKDRQVYDSLHHFVNTFAALDRHLTPDGKSVEEPQVVQVLCVKEHIGYGLKLGDRKMLAKDLAEKLAEHQFVIIL
jgi:hypothetical protein